jgi:hypothetical protein
MTLEMGAKMAKRRTLEIRKDGFLTITLNHRSSESIPRRCSYYMIRWSAEFDGGTLELCQNNVGWFSRIVEADGMQRPVKIKASTTRNYAAQYRDQAVINLANWLVENYFASEYAESLASA